MTRPAAHLGSALERWTAPIDVRPERPTENRLRGDRRTHPGAPRPAPARRPGADLGLRGRRRPGIPRPRTGRRRSAGGRPRRAPAGPRLRRQPQNGAAPPGRATPPPQGSATPGRARHPGRPAETLRAVPGPPARPSIRAHSPLPRPQTSRLTAILNRALPRTGVTSQA